MILSTFVFLPPMWLPNLALLSNLSAIGVFASLFLLGGVVSEGFMGLVPDLARCKLVDGCTGSILSPSPTTLYKVSPCCCCLYSREMQY